MLYSVLRSRRAVQVNVEIMRAFVMSRQLHATHEDLARKLTELDQNMMRNSGLYSMPFGS